MQAHDIHGTTPRQEEGTIVLVINVVFLPEVLTPPPSLSLFLSLSLSPSLRPSVSVSIADFSIVHCTVITPTLLHMVLARGQ